MNTGFQRRSRLAIGSLALASLAMGCGSNAGIGDPNAGRPFELSDRAGLYIGDSRCDWTDYFSDGTKKQGSYSLSTALIVNEQGEVSFDGEPLRIGAQIDAAVGGSTATATVTNLDTAPDGFIWGATFSGTSANGGYDATVGGAVRFEDSGEITFRRTTSGTGTLFGEAFSEVEQCRGTLTP